MARQDSDNLAWDQSDERWEVARKQVRLSSTCNHVETFAKQILGPSATLITPLMIGGFNVLYPVRIEEPSESLLIRMPCPNPFVFPEEKLLAEAATISWITQQTQLSVPKIFRHGINPQVGPFMIVEDLGSRRDMSDALEAPRKDPSETPILNPVISDDKLKSLYIQLARYVLQLAQPTFPCIGALTETKPGTYCVSRRPVTLNMINMVQLSNIPKSILPSEGSTYHTADDWYVALAEMHMATLLFQHNDIVSTEDDCKTKYVARQIFRRLAKQGRLSNFGFSGDNWSASSKHTHARLPAPDSAGSFRLWADDFRPSNVLVDNEDRILGAIDWEFAYAGPTQFVLDPPWWLLLDVPEMWDEGIDDWTSIYEQRLQSWLSAIEEAEQDMKAGSLFLSQYMRESWDTGRFWLNYAARKSWAFDTIYWKYLDELFFGEREKGIPNDELWKTREHLLTDEERVVMEPMVKMKIEESKDRILVEWDSAEARERLSQFLFD